MKFHHFSDLANYTKRQTIHYAKVYILDDSKFNGNFIIAHELRSNPRMCRYVINYNEKSFIFKRKKLKDSSFNKICWKYYINRKKYENNPNYKILRQNWRHSDRR